MTCFSLFGLFALFSLDEGATSGLATRVGFYIKEK